MKHVKNSVKNSMIAFVLAAALTGWAAPAFCAGPLDGQVFEGAVGPKGEKDGRPEEISFKDGKFHSSACDAYGFGDGAYTARKRGKGVRFEADTVNAKGAKLHWKGMVTDNQVEATSVLNAPGEKPSESWAKGTLKK